MLSNVITKTLKGYDIRPDERSRRQSSDKAVAYASDDLVCCGCILKRDRLVDLELVGLGLCQLTPCSKTFLVKSSSVCMPNAHLQPLSDAA